MNEVDDLRHQQDSCDDRAQEDDACQSADDGTDPRQGASILAVGADLSQGNQSRPQSDQTQHRARWETHITREWDWGDAAAERKNRQDCGDEADDRGSIRRNRIGWRFHHRIL